MTISGDPDGTIWAGTYGDGLYRYKDGSSRTTRTANGLFDDIVFQIVDDRARQSVDDVQPRRLPGQQTDAARPSPSGA